MKGNWRWSTPGETTVSGLLFLYDSVPKYGPISYRRMGTRAIIVIAIVLANHRWSCVTSTCIVLTIACHVPFFVERRFVFQRYEAEVPSWKVWNFEKIGHALTEITQFRRQDSKVTKTIVNFPDARQNAASSGGTKAKVRKWRFI